jgi:multidrug efflux pump subunit AcrA (membrane-fusion protein)
LVSVSASVIAVLLLVGCGEKNAAPGDPALQDNVPVRLRKPERVERKEQVRASGSIEAESTRNLGFPIPGRVARVLADEGQQVKPGQALAELERADYEYALEAARGQEAAALATLAKANQGPRPEELEQARIDFERWSDEYRRMKTLYEKKSLPENDFRKVEAAWKAASQRYEMARAGTRQEDKAASEGLLQQARAQMAGSRKRLEDTVLRSPIGGYVGMRRVDAGEVVAAGQPLFSVMNLHPVKVRVGIPESSIGMVRAGQPAQITIPALGNRAFPGTVELVGVAAEPTSRTYTVKINAANPGTTMRAGMIAEATIEGDRPVSILTLPPDAIVRDPQGATYVFVYYPEQKRVYRKRVEIGASTGSEVVILSGLSGEEQVVVAGQTSVREGSSVRVEGDLR